MKISQANIDKITSEAIGATMRVKTSSKNTVTGTIVSAEYSHTRLRAASQVAVFKIVMECGFNKTLREFHVSKLPRK